MRIMTAAKSLFIVLVTVGLLGANPANAALPVPTGSTPSLYGAQVLEPGAFVLGATTGYPKTSVDGLSRAHLYFGYSF